MKILCKIGGSYCIVITLIDRYIRYSALRVMLGYFIIPIIGLRLLEKYLNRK